MIAIIDASGQLREIVYSAAGLDLAGCTIVDPVPEPTYQYRWDVSAQAFVLRPPTAAENAQIELHADLLWSTLRNASAQQIDAWLAANVTNLAGALRVLKLLLLALRALATRDQL